MHTVLFLPGAGGSPLFWKPVADRLPSAWQKVHFGWPGLGDQPHDPTINNVDDLVALVETRIAGPVNLVAQSMGGVVAVRIALARPHIVRRGVPLLREGDQVGIENARLSEAEQASKLIGEGLEQIDLSVGERAYLVISHRAL